MAITIRSVSWRTRPKKLRIAAGIKYGKICSGCAHHCDDPPTPSEPMWVRCTECQGRDSKCKVCGGNVNGLMLIECPRKCVTPDIVRLLRIADEARLGLLPVAGGTLDQPESLMRAIQSVHHEEAPYRSRAGLD